MPVFRLLRGGHQQKDPKTGETRNFFHSGDNIVRSPHDLARMFGHQKFQQVSAAEALADVPKKKKPKKKKRSLLDDDDDTEDTFSVMTEAELVAFAMEEQISLEGVDETDRAELLATVRAAGDDDA